MQLSNDEAGGIGKHHLYLFGNRPNRTPFCGYLRAHRPKSQLTEVERIANNQESFNIGKALKMKKGALEEQILRASKEIAVKFIEVGRLSPTGFPETFKTIYQSIDDTVRGNMVQGSEDEESPPQK